MVVIWPGPRLKPKQKLALVDGPEKRDFEKALTWFVLRCNNRRFLTLGSRSWTVPVYAVIKCVPR